MDTAVSVVLRIGEYLWGPLVQHTGYLINFNDNVKELNARLEELVARRNYVERILSTGRSAGQEEIKEVLLWCDRAVGMEEEAKMIEKGAGELKRCLCGPNPSWRYSISKKAKETAILIAGHHEKGEFERVTMPSLHPMIEKQDAPSIEGLTSAKLALEKVMKALSTENVKKIGVWGMGGVGKTTLMDNLNNQMEDTHHFSKVVMVTVSKDVDVKRIQDDIAKCLDFPFDNDTEASPAKDLRKRLMQEKFLIILDDLWVRLNLASVGIPRDDLPDGCKIIVTTRSEAVCRQMETQVNIRVDVLSSEEAWKLFKEKAGDIVDDSTLHTMAREVVEECGGLPLAITTLGTALRGVTNQWVWNNALSQLKRSAPSDIEGMEDKVYHSIKVSYDFLRSELKPCFLFCALFPEDYVIDVDMMVRFWKGEGFLDDVGSLEEMTNKGYSWVEELKSSCLLLAGETEGRMKMHDVVRDVAVSIASKDEEGCKSLVRAGIGFKGLPQGRKWEEYKRISLMRSGITELPDGMCCTNLVTLLMQENQGLTTIPRSFFELNKTLRVLDLRKTAITRLPPSISDLVDLRMLCLKECRFTTRDSLSPLGGLKLLEFLDLSNNMSLRELPTEIGELVNLRSLDLTFTPSLVVIPCGVLSRLTQLEELKMSRSFSKWEVAGVTKESNSSSNATWTEVASLTELYWLDIQIRDDYPFPEDLQLKSWMNLKKFRICKFDTFQSDYVYNFSTFRSIVDSDSHRRVELYGSSPTTGLVSMLLTQTTDLTLYQHARLRQLDEVGSFQNLEYLKISKCYNMECVFSEKAKEAPKLQRLVLISLPKLEKILVHDYEGEDGSLPTTCLPDLRQVNVSFCSRLKHVLPFSSSQRMDNLTTVTVDNCGRMEHVFGGPPADMRLSSLNNISLESLINMKSIWATGLVVTLQNLTSLSLWRCDGLNKAVLSSMQIKGGLPNLSKLEIGCCEEVEEIISEVVDKEGLLPKLRALALHSLPSLVSICGIQGGQGEAAGPLQLDWHSLEVIEVYGCPKLDKLLPLQGGAQGVPLLQKIKGEKDWWEGLDWDGDHAIKDHFQSLFIGEKEEL